MAFIADIVFFVSEPVMSLISLGYVESYRERSKAQVELPDMQSQLRLQNDQVPQLVRSMIASYVKELGIQHEKLFFIENTKAHKSLEGKGSFKNGETATLFLSPEFIGRLQRQGALNIDDKYQVARAVAEIHEDISYSGIISLKEQAALMSGLAYIATQLAIEWLASPQLTLMRTHLVSCTAAFAARHLAEFAISRFQQERVQERAGKLILSSNERHIQPMR